MATTKPIDDHDVQTAPRLVVAASYEAPDGSVYVHQDLQRVVEPWAVEAHIGPVKRTERFGDVESWVAYVRHFGADDDFPPMLTWSEAGLRAVLDYHGSIGDPGRCQWEASHPFERSIAWKAWQALANGHPRSQKELIDALEDLAEDVVEPEAAELVGILGTLRATVRAQADTELKADGSTHVAFTKDKTIAAGKLSLPPSFAIAIPVLKGHVEDRAGKLFPVTYKLPVRVRPSVNDNAQLAFRLSMPTADRVLEAVYADRVAKASELLGEGYTLLRASGG